MKILCTICARAGSKEVKNKNTRKINGKPLIYHTIKEAKKIKIFDQIVISSDSKKILDLGYKYKIKNNLKRPKHLSRDNAAKIPVIRHALIEMEKKYNQKYSVIVDLDVTSPLRKVKDIIGAINKFKTKKLDTLFSVNNARKNPYYNSVEIKKNKILPVKKNAKQFVSRQEAPKVYDMNAAISIWNRNILLSKNTLFTKKTGIFIMPENRSIDIDTEFEFEIVNLLMKKKIT